MCTVPCFQFRRNWNYWSALSHAFSSMINLTKPPWDYKNTMHQNALSHILSLITKPTKPPLKLPTCAVTCFQFHDLHYYTAQTTDMHYHMLSVSWSTLLHRWDYWHALSHAFSFMIDTTTPLRLLTCTITCFQFHDLHYYTAETTDMHYHMLSVSWSTLLHRSDYWHALSHAFSFMIYTTTPLRLLTCTQFHDQLYENTAKTTMHQNALLDTLNFIIKPTKQPLKPQQCTNMETHWTTAETTTMHQYALYHTFSCIIKRTKPLLTQRQYTEMLCIILALTLSNFQECKLD